MQSKDVRAPATSPRDVGAYEHQRVEPTTLWDGTTALEVRVASTADADLQAQGQQLVDDLNAFVSGSDPFSLSLDDDLTTPHIRVRVFGEWSEGEPDWWLYGDGAVMWVEARSTAWLTRAVARVSWELGKRMWFPDDVWIIQPTLSEIKWTSEIRKTNDYAFVGALGTAGGTFNFGTYETNFAEWRRINMVSSVESANAPHAEHAVVNHYLGTGRWTEGEDCTTGYYDDNGKWQNTPNRWFAMQDRTIDDIVDYFVGEAHDNDFISISASDGTRGYEQVPGWGRDGEGNADGWNETEINLYVAHRVIKAIADHPSEAVRNTRVGMLAYGVTSYHPDPTKRWPDGTMVHVPDDLHVIVTRGFFQSGTGQWEGVHGAYRDAEIGAAGKVQYSGYWYGDGWKGNKDVPGTMGIARYSVLDDWWTNNAPWIGRGYPRIVMQETSPAHYANGIGTLIWYRMWREETETLDEARDAVRAEVLEAFPTAGVATAVGSYYDRVMFIDDGSFAPVLSEDLLYHAFNDLKTALDDAGITAAEVARVNRLVLYTRFVELYYLTLNADLETSGGLDQYDEFRSFLYNTRYYGICSYRLWTFLDEFAFGAAEDLEARYAAGRDPYALHHIGLENHPSWVPASWQSGGAYEVDLSDLGIYTMASNGVSNNTPYTFTTIGYPQDPFDGMEKPTPAKSASVPISRANIPWYDRNDALTLWVKTQAGQTTIDWWAKPFASYSNEDVVLEVVDSTGVATATHTFDTADGDAWRLLSLPVAENTVYQVRLTSGKKQGLRLNWWTDPSTAPDSGAPIDISGTWLVSWRRLPAGTPTLFGGVPQWWFYVPASATELGGLWSKAGGEIRDADDNTIVGPKVGSTYDDFDYNLSAGEKDTVMRGSNIGQNLTLMTVPPYMAWHPDELIVPAGVDGS